MAATKKNLTVGKNNKTPKQNGIIRAYLALLRNRWEKDCQVSTVEPLGMSVQKERGSDQTQENDSTRER